MKTIQKIIVFYLLLTPIIGMAETSEMNARFDLLFNFLWAIIGIFTTMMVSIFGFAFWDRKLSLAPMKKDYLKTLTALRDYSEYQPKLKEILKSAGLL
ncbi:MAG: hypothetical protein NT004_08440 [Bacteroidetes bacterium]|nr:hypothetical protein [Bacteroidota bacterium]